MPDWGRLGLSAVNEAVQGPLHIVSLSKSKVVNVVSANAAHIIGYSNFCQLFCNICNAE